MRIGLHLFISMIALLAACGQDKQSKRSTGKKTPPQIDDIRQNADQTNVFQQNPTCKSAAINQDLRTDTIVYTGKKGLFKYDVKANSTVHIQAGVGSLEVSSQFNLVEAPSSGRDEANNILRKLSGLRLGDLFRGSWEKFYSEQSHPTVKCSVFPIVSMTERSGDGTESVVSFSPALPYLVSPSEDMATYQTELANGMIMKNIKATVTKRNDDNVTDGQVIDGQVSIQKAPQNSITQYGADTGYTVIVDFGGSFEITAALGLLYKATYYIKGGTFIKVVVETGNDKVPTLEYKK